MHCFPLFVFCEVFEFHQIICSFSLPNLHHLFRNPQISSQLSFRILGKQGESVFRFIIFQDYGQGGIRDSVKRLRVQIWQDVHENQLGQEPHLHLAKHQVVRKGSCNFVPTESIARGCPGLYFFGMVQNKNFYRHSQSMTVSRLQVLFDNNSFRHVNRSG